MDNEPSESHLGGLVRALAACHERLDVLNADEDQRGPEARRSSTGQPLRPPASFADLAKYTTHQVAGDDAFVGDW